MDLITKNELIETAIDEYCIEIEKQMLNIVKNYDNTRTFGEFSIIHQLFDAVFIRFQKAGYKIEKVSDKYNNVHKSILRIYFFE